jgi:two-component system OmpR family response regulator
MKSNMKILVVEDDPNLGILLTEYLNAKGYNATLRTDGQQGHDAFKTGEFDFLILDVMMPIKDGFTLAREIRNEDKDIPILFLTAKSMKEDTLEGFNAGGDDYMTKPFSMEELLARINAILRRSASKSKDKDITAFVIGGYQFDYMQQMLTIGDENQKLTTKENELLKLLCLNVNDVLERNDALNKVWGDDNYFNGRSMDVYIAKLRKYLKKDPSIEIMNVHGKGFKLVNENN